MTVTLDATFQLDDRVALRPEPFGALAYHYGNRRLVFLRSPKMVGVVESLGAVDSVQAALDANGIAEDQRAAYLVALGDLEHAEVIRARQ